jgi:hypothetical protein
MARLFRDHPQAVIRTSEIAEACTFSLDELKYEYPDEPVPKGTPQKHLEALTWAGARKRYPQGLPDKVRANLVKELALIGKLGYAPYFLTVHDIVNFARTRPETDPVPGPRLGGQLRRVLLHRHHRGGPGSHRPVVRALHLRRAARSRPTSTSTSNTNAAKK